MNDFAAARTAYEERLDLASTTDDGVLLADAHYDIGFLAMIEGDADQLRAQEQLALDLYQAAHREDGVLRARQALVLGVFLTGDYAAALELEELNLEAFRRTGAQYLIADSMTLQAGIYWRLGDPGTSWLRLQEALRYFHETDNASGYARALGMAAIVLLADGDGELGARIAGATYRLVREKGVMLAPVKVLHLPEPADTAARAVRRRPRGRAAGRGRGHPDRRRRGDGPGEAVTGSLTVDAAHPRPGWTPEVGTGTGPARRSAGPCICEGLLDQEGVGPARWWSCS